jgi:thiol-disulfide isomerase/thioredoxin
MVLNNGQVFDLAKEKGKVVLIEVLLTHCPGCQSGARMLSAMAPEFTPKGVKFVGMAINEDAALGLQQFVSQYATAFPVGIRNVQFAMDFLQHSTMKRFLLPRLVFVDRKGMIRAHYGADEPWMEPAVEEKNVRALLTQLAAEGGAAGASTKGAAKSSAKK